MSYPARGGPYKPGAHQSVSYTGTAGTISSAVSAGVSVVRVLMTTAGYVAFGTSPTATTSDIYMPAGVPEYFEIPSGGTTKVSAIQAASGGSLHVTEMSH